MYFFTFRRRHFNSHGKCDTFKKVNRILAKDIRRGMFVTAIYMVLDIQDEEWRSPLRHVATHSLGWLRLRWATSVKDVAHLRAK